MAREDLGLPVVRQVPRELGNDDMGRQCCRRHAAIHEARRRGSLDDAILACPAGIARANGSFDAQNGRNDIECHALRLSNVMERAGAAGARAAFRLDNDVVARQVLGKKADIAGCGLSATSLVPGTVRLIVVGGDRNSRKITEIETGLCGVDCRKPL